jgi:phospholipid-translocating ATPase
VQLDRQHLFAMPKSIETAPSEAQVETAAESSKPIKKLRWAPHRLTGFSERSKRASGDSTDSNKNKAKRTSLIDKVTKLGKSSTASEKANGKQPDRGDGDDSSESSQEPLPQRRIYVNQPLPDSEKDEDGRPLQHFPRNKIRTAKYTPLSFIPKNLYFQFHRVANIYFLFVIILGVSLGQKLL